jgi:hypothetical protein
MNEYSLMQLWLGCCQFMFWLYLSLAALVIIWCLLNDEPPKK